MFINEIFSSINGEVNSFHQGSLTTFIRTSGCPLRCAWCDTKYAQKLEDGMEATLPEILGEVESIGLPLVTLTGGDPMYQLEEFVKLLKFLRNRRIKVVVETSGYYRIPFDIIPLASCWVVDWKTPSSGMNTKMDLRNYLDLREQDWIKMPIEDNIDLREASYVYDRLKHIKHPSKIAFSPVFGKMKVATLMKWLFDRKMYDVVINTQMHKLTKVA